MGTYEIKKISLSCFEDKRFLLNDEIHTLAYVHKDTDSYWWWEGLKKIFINKEVLKDDHK